MGREDAYLALYRLEQLTDEALKDSGYPHGIGTRPDELPPGTEDEARERAFRRLNRAERRAVAQADRRRGQ